MPAIFLLGAAAGALAVYLLSPSAGKFLPGKGRSVSAERSGGFRFVNPLLDCAADDLDEPLPFKPKITAILDKSLSENALAEAAVYFRDLNNGPWFGINQDALFSPGSLLKVPMMMAVLKQSERRPAFLTEKIVYDGVGRKLPEFGAPEERLIPGQPYTVFDLIKKMITVSSNEAASLLFDLVDHDVFMRIYRELGVVPDKDKVTPDESFLTVRQYASFFRILFNASYLSRESSELALAILSEGEYDRGLRAGVDKGVAVANKFGSREHAGVMQIHDCGIVYYPGAPYLLCVMTRGTDVGAMEQTIAAVSRATFEELKMHTTGEIPSP